MPRSVSHRRLRLLAPLLLITGLLPAYFSALRDIPSAAAAPAPTTSRPFKNVLAIGTVGVDKDILTIKGPNATLVIGDKNSDTYRMTAEIQLSKKAGATYVQVMPTDPQDFEKPAALYASFGRDAAGLHLSSSTYRYDAATKKWAGNPDVAYYRYWPDATDKAGLALVALGKLPKRSWHDRWLRLRVEADRLRVAFWLEGMLVRQFDRPAGSKGPVALKVDLGDRLRAIQLAPLGGNDLYLPVDLAPWGNDHFAKPIGKLSLQMAGVPFELASAGQNHLNLHNAHWLEWKNDPADYYEWYDYGPYTVHDAHMPLLRVPIADYSAAHVLAVAEDDAKRTNVLSLRAGRYGYNEQVVQHDYAGRVPRKSDAGKTPANQQVNTAAGPLFHVRVPMTEAFAQDMERFIEIELTKELRLARHQPDPNRFRIRPLGLPSGVRIAALTLERSPLQMRVGSKESGHAFVEPQKPAFQVRLQNITTAEQAYQLTFQATHFDGSKTEVKQAGRAAVGQTAEVAAVVPTLKRGYHDLLVTLHDGGGRTLLQRRTSFALLPPDTRKHRQQSPFGTWDFCGGHYTSSNPDETGPLYVKLGLRYGMFGNKPEARRKYGVLPGNELKISDLKAWEDNLKLHPDYPPIGLIFHEDGISGEHLTRVPDLFHNHPPYQLNDKEKKQFKLMWDSALAAAKAIKGKYPKVHLRFGNGALPTKEEFYRNKFPADLFDSAGNESGSFHRQPEAQPPDCVGNNSGLWMDRQMLDAYGYKNKPVTQCLEVCYPNSNPGNLSAATQADYFVRHGLHSLAWKIPEIKIGCISDMGNSYYFSNWGAAGYCRSKPELNVKPAFVAMATMTLVLDGAKFLRVLPLGSTSLYGLEFERPDGMHVHALWTLRGRRPVKLQGDKGALAWKRIDSQGNETDLVPAKGQVEVTLTPSPFYLVGKGRLIEAEPGQPVYAAQPAGKSTLLSSLASADDWILDKGRNVELEYYNFMCPRRKGNFTFLSVKEFEGKKDVMQVLPRPIKHGKDTMPMYSILVHRKGIAVPGQPTEIGLWLNGNCGWGRPMFELVDAAGQRWTSIGAQQDGVDRKWLASIMPKDVLAKFPRPGISDWNTEDVYGLSRINFDGWRYVAFPLPGNYPGEGYPWLGNSQWRWDKDGVVHYPLTFKKLIIELPEKVLHVKTFAAPPRPEIYLKDLTVGQDDTLHSATIVPK